ncbi:MAG: phosphoglucosamine mutase, partial [Chloroflexi bacterium]|nr:phosphoglucosamine mutase [Chloroflexota bacterium]
VMRLLNQQYKERLSKQIDGCKIELGKDVWVLVLPDPDRPLFHIHAQAGSAPEARELADKYVRIVESLQD